MAALEDMVGAMTVGELARLAGRSIEHVVDAAMGPRNGARAQPRKRATAGDRPGSVPRGGLQLDAVLAALASVGAPAKLDDVRGRTGGTVPQVRSALQKLAASGKLRITGERRATRYVAR